MVLFYQTFATSYFYTKLGYIENLAGLEEAWGQESVKVTFQLDLSWIGMEIKK